MPACWPKNSPSEVRYHKLQEGGGELQLLMSPQGIDLSDLIQASITSLLIVVSRLFSLCLNCEAQLTQDDKQVQICSMPLTDLK